MSNPVSLWVARVLRVALSQGSDGLEMSWAAFSVKDIHKGTWRILAFYLFPTTFHQFLWRRKQWLHSCTFIHSYILCILSLRTSTPTAKSSIEWLDLKPWTRTVDGNLGQDHSLSGEMVLQWPTNKEVSFQVPGVAHLQEQLYEEIFSDEMPSALRRRYLNGEKNPLR